MRMDAGTPEEDEADAIDLEAAARDVWEDGLRLSDLAAEAPREFRFQVQEGLLRALQAHITGLSSEQAQVCPLFLALLSFTLRFGSDLPLVEAIYWRGTVGLRLQAQEGLLCVLQAHIGGFSPKQAQACAPCPCNAWQQMLVSESLQPSQTLLACIICPGCHQKQCTRSESVSGSSMPHDCAAVWYATCPEHCATSKYGFWVKHATRLCGCVVCHAP